MYQKVDYPPRPCEHCQNPFKPKSYRSIFCSKSCANKHRDRSRDKPKRTRRKLRGPFICKVCNKSYFTRRPKGEGETCCSRACGFVYEGRIKKEKGSKKPAYCIAIPSHCKHCSKYFVARSPLRVYCSTLCAKGDGPNRTKRYGIKKKKLVLKNCRQCGKSFAPKYGDKRRLFCSKRCVERFHRKTMQAKRRMQEARDRRALRMALGKVETFSYWTIAKRDGWKCHICLKTIDRKKKWPDRMSPTFDHLIPISIGGEHTRANVRLAHFSCNTKRGNKGAAQLLLLG